MTDKQIIVNGIDITKCRYNTFDGGNTQRTICTIDGCFCDCLREKECYYKQLKLKERECEKWKNAYEVKEDALTESEEECEKLEEQRNKLKKELKVAKGLAKIRYQCLEAIKELAGNANLPNVGLYIDSFLNEMSNKDENCHFDKIKELTKEM